jgi:anti-anti-sigma factor
VYHASAHKEQLLASLSGGAGLLLDLSRVGEIDTAGVQLLLLLQREAARMKKTFSVLAVSEGVRDVLEFCRLQSLLPPSQA